MKIIKKVVLVGFLLLQAACSEAGSINVLHVHSTTQPDNSNLYNGIKPGCDEYYKIGYSENPFTIIGDESILGKGVVDEYWSRDGRYRARYEIRYTTEPQEMCVYKVVPEIKVEYQNFITTKTITYKRTYKEPGGDWGMLEDFKSGKLDVGGAEESARAVQVPEKYRKMKAPEFLADTVTGKPKVIGKEKIAGKSCDVITTSRFNVEGFKLHSCGWDPQDPNLPDKIALKTYVKLGENPNATLGGTTVAQAVHERVNVPLKLILPSAELDSLPVDDFRSPLPSARK